MEFPIYNPIQIQPDAVPFYAQETYDCYTPTFFLEIGGANIDILLRHASNETVTFTLISEKGKRDVISGSLVASIGGKQYRRHSIPKADKNGVYQIEIISVIGVTGARFLSEKFSIFQRERERKYLSLSAWNDTNRNGVFGTSGAFKIGKTMRFEAKDTTQIRTDSTMYKMSNGRNVVLDAESYNVREFIFGGKRGMSRYHANATMFALYCDNVLIDGVKYRLVKEPELVKIDNYDNMSVKCELTPDVVDVGMWQGGLDTTKQWILSKGIWDDDGLWKDTSNWID